MKLLLLVPILVLVALGTPKAEPELTIPDNRYEFGFVPRNSKVVHYFTFKSTGDEPLVIDSINTGCVCALMPLEKTRLAPGESMDVGIVWDIKSRIGNIGRYPYIYTNAQEQAYRVYLSGVAVRRADSVKPVSAKPFRLEFAKLPSNSIDSVEFSLTNHEDDTLQVKVVSHELTQVVLPLPEVLAPGETWRGTAYLTPETGGGAFEESVTVEFSNERQSRLTIPLRRKVY